jgi:hypothetical protein
MNKKKLAGVVGFGLSGFGAVLLFWSGEIGVGLFGLSMVFISLEGIRRADESSS